MPSEAFLRRMREARTVAAARPPDDLSDALVLAARERIGAVLLASPYGQVWLVVGDADRMRAELVAEEREREARGEVARPVLLVAEVARMRGMNPDLIRALLDVRAAFPGAEVVQ